MLFREGQVHEILLRAKETTHSQYYEGTRKVMNSEAYNISSSKSEQLRRMRERQRRRTDQDDNR